MNVRIDPYTFTNGTVADALEVNARFDELYDVQNGGIDSDNMDLTDNFAWTGDHTFGGTLGITGDFTVDTDTLFVDASEDSVGIGTITPDVRLHVYGTDTDSSTIKIERISADASGSFLKFYKTRTVGGVGVAADGIGATSFYSNDDASAEVVYAQNVAYIVDPTAGAEEGRQLFNVMANGSLTPGLAIVGQSTGNVYSGFGINTPGTRIYVYGTDTNSSTIYQKRISNDALGVNQIYYKERTAGGAGQIADIVGAHTYISNDDAGNDTDYVQTFARIKDPTNTSEDGTYGINIMLAGTLTRNATFESGHLIVDESDVLGINNNYAIRGSDDGDALYGDLSRRWDASPAGPDYMGVLGYNGVVNASYCGVYGYTAADYGVYGYASDDYGVYGRAADDYGVYGYAGGSYGVYGVAVTNYAVYGAASVDYGVYGSALGDYAIYGLASGSYGGHFEANGASSVGCFSDGTSGGYDFYAGGAGTNYGPFTGGHEAIISKDSYDESYWKPGMILCCTGDIIKREGSISSTVPELKLSDSDNDKNSFSVFTALRTIQEKHSSDYWFYDLIDWDVYTLATSNSLGEGQVLVTNKNGIVEKGDYVTTSTIKGYGQKQDDDLLHSYTIAKATETIDWDSITEIIDGYKVALIACTYHCG